MTVEHVGVFKGKFTVELFSKQFMAVRAMKNKILTTSVSNFKFDGLSPVGYRLKTA